MLRDMRTRFGRTYWHYLVAIAWPMSHLLGIVLGFTLMNRILPIGADSLVFISTGALPYILCLYPARQCALSFMMGRAALSFPIVHTLDVILARVILEVLSACFVCLLFCIGLWMCGVDLMPQDMPQAITGVLAAIFFGISVGLCIVILAGLTGIFGYGAAILALVGLYLGSGVYLPTMGAGEQLRFWLNLNPMGHLVEWVRSAYFETHTVVELDKAYVIRLSAGALVCGLTFERLFRGRLIA